MRTKTPPTNVYFIAKSHVRRGGGAEKTYQFVCIIKCKQKGGEKKHQHKCVQQHHHPQHLFIPVCLQYNLRVPSSLQQSSATIYSHQVRKYVVT